MHKEMSVQKRISMRHMRHIDMRQMSLKAKGIPRDGVIKDSYFMFCIVPRVEYTYI